MLAGRNTEKNGTKGKTISFLDHMLIIYMQVDISPRHTRLLQSETDSVCFDILAFIPLQNNVIWRYHRNNGIQGTVIFHTWTLTVKDLLNPLFIKPPSLISPYPWSQKFWISPLSIKPPYKHVNFHKLSEILNVYSWKKSLHVNLGIVWDNSLSNLCIWLVKLHLESAKYEAKDW